MTSHHVSIGPTQSVSGNAPEISNMPSTIPSSSRTVSLPITDMGSYIDTTAEVEFSLIEELIVREEESTSQHPTAFFGEDPSEHNGRAPPRPGGVSHEVRLYLSRRDAKLSLTLLLQDL